MNIKIENNKQLIFFLASVGLVVVALSVFILFAFSNNGSNQNNSQTGSSTSSATSSTTSSGPEQTPERITDFYSALPFISSEFNVDYNPTSKIVTVSSTKYEVSDLTAVFKNWIKRFPNLNVNTLNVKYIGASAFIIDKIKAN